MTPPCPHPRRPRAVLACRRLRTTLGAALLAPGLSAANPPDPATATATATATLAAATLATSPTTAPAADRIEVRGRHYDNAVGGSDAASQGVIRAELLKSRPALRPGEVLEFVPGVIVTQHSGDGKANQYFLRGFNLDHGTDFATTVDGLPVNMPSHGHGQGYADLNFLIPELVDRIAYRKGPYFADTGDFSAAGAADIRYRTRLEAPFAQLSLGERGYRRGVLAGARTLGGTAGGDGADDLTLLGALELMHNDGPWTVPEGLNRRNGVLTLSQGTAARGWQASLMGYGAAWTATDQVPQRLIDASSLAGQPFGRWDSLNPSDGGRTRRLSLSGQWHQQDAGGRTQLAAYAMDYGLQLWSDFTYQLERGAQGDQFEQRDSRRVLGLSASRRVDHGLAGLEARTEWGLQVRDDRIRQTQLGLYGHSTLTLAPGLRGLVGLRADRLDARVDSLSLAANSGSAQAIRLSPKLGLVAGPWAQTEVFVNLGRGLHSNDARGMTIRTDPKTGEDATPVSPLVAARGWELGLRSEWLPGLQSSLALWRLLSDSELVYVGDAGTTEEGPASRRHGLEWNNRWTPTRWLLVDADLAWTRARFANGDRIPNAVDRVGSLAFTLRELGPWSLGLNWRYLGSGALVEDNSVRSTPSLTTNLRASWTLPGAWGLGRDSALTLDVFNLLNRRVNDIQYWYASDVGDGQGAVDDLHVHPAEPRTVRLTLRLAF